MMTVHCDMVTGWQGDSVTTQGVAGGPHLWRRRRRRCGAGCGCGSGSGRCRCPAAGRCPASAGCSDAGPSARSVTPPAARAPAPPQGGATTAPSGPWTTCSSGHQIIMVGVVPGIKWFIKHTPFIEVCCVSLSEGLWWQGLNRKYRVASRASATLSA